MVISIPVKDRQTVSESTTSNQESGEATQKMYEEYVEKRLEDKHINLELTKSAKDYLIDNGYDEIYGARPLKRFVQKKLETLIAKKILSQEILPNTTVAIDCINNELELKK